LSTYVAIASCIQRLWCTLSHEVNLTCCTKILYTVTCLIFIQNLYLSSWIYVDRLISREGNKHLKRKSGCRHTTWTWRLCHRFHINLVTHFSCLSAATEITLSLMTSASSQVLRRSRIFRSATSKGRHRSGPQSQKPGEPNGWVKLSLPTTNSSPNLNPNPYTHAVAMADLSDGVTVWNI